MKIKAVFMDLDGTYSARRFGEETTDLRTRL